MKTKRAVTLALALAAGLLGWGLSRVSLFRNLELLSLDARFQLRPSTESPEEISLIAVDDESRQAMARAGVPWPWNRRYYASLLPILALHPPKVIGFDLTLDAPMEAEGDGLLFHATDAFPVSRFVYGYYFRMRGQEGLSPPTEEEERTLEAFSLGPAKGGRIPEAYKAVLPMEGFFRTVAREDIGFLNAPAGNTPGYSSGENADGKIRSLPLLIRHGENHYPSLVMSLLLAYLEADRRDVSVEEKQIRIRAKKGDVMIPIDDEGRLLLNYREGLRHYHALPFEHLLKIGSQSHATSEEHDRTEALREDILKGLKDRIVLIAVTATGMDTGPTPLSPATPLCVAHLTALENVLHSDYLHRASPGLRFSLCIVMALFIFLLGGGVGPLRAALRCALVLFAYLLALLCVFRWNLWLPFVGPTLSLVLSYGLITTYRYFSEEREKRFVRKAFGHYISANVMRTILENPSRLRLGGERRTLTILFSDIRGFTSFCEKRAPEEVSTVLNAYLDRMTYVILRNDGTLDKYVGDEIMAFWGAPLPQEDHALRAVRAALEMGEELRRIREEREASGEMPLDMGIGLHTGPVIGGNMGSSRLFDYTVLGDNVNLAARVESLTREYGARILITEETLERVRALVSVREIGSTLVKGRERPVRIYELLGWRERE